MLQRPVLWMRQAFGLGSHLITSRRGIRWELDLQEGIDFAIFLQGAFEPSTARALAKHLKPGATILDIGANIGAHTLPMAKLAGEKGRVIAFEPTEFAFTKLIRNLELNPGLVPIVMACQIMLVGADEDVLEPMIYSSWPLDGGDDLHSVHRARPMSTIGARAQSLDQFLKENNVDNVDLIKVDVDGHECAVFDGAEQTLHKHHPILVMELAPYVLEEAGTSLEELLGQLRKHNYHFFDEVTEERLPLDSDALRKHIPAGGSRNVIAIAP